MDHLRVGLVVDGAIVDVLVFPADATVSSDGSAVHIPEQQPEGQEVQPASDFPVPEGGRFVTADGIDRNWTLDKKGVPVPPQPPAVPAERPASVSSAQAKIQLRRANLRDKVDAAVQQAGGEVQDWFTDARTWERKNPYVVELGTALGLKDADIDALFIEAAKIQA